jgi:hypothetical protein
MSRIAVIVAPVDVTKLTSHGLEEAATLANELGSELGERRRVRRAARDMPGARHSGARADGESGRDDWTHAAHSRMKTRS